MATSGRTRGHQRAGFMAAGGQKPLALDTPLWPTSVPHPVGEWCGTAPRPASGSPYDNDEDGPRELRRDEQIDGDEDCPHQDGDNRGGRSVRCALAACGTGLALCLLVVLKCDGHRRDQPPLCLSAIVYLRSRRRCSAGPVAALTVRVADAGRGCGGRCRAESGRWKHPFSDSKRSGQLWVGAARSRDCFPLLLGRGRHGPAQRGPKGPTRGKQG